MRVGFSVIGFLFVIGCTTSLQNASLEPDAISVFRRNHPEIARHYLLLREANIDRYFDLWRIEAGIAQTTMQRLKEEFGHVEGVVTFADRVSAGEKEKIENLRKEILALKRAADGEGKLCEFEYSFNGEREWGVLVLRNGEIVKRVVWANDAISVEEFPPDDR